MPADAQRVVRTVYLLLGRSSQQELPAQDVQAARIESGMEVLRAIASNAKGGYFQSLAAPVGVPHDSFLPAHDGEPGIPRIVPFEGADAREGLWADPDDIDSWRNDSPTAPIYTGAGDGLAVAHDQPDSDGRPSPVTPRYSLVGGRLKFTGLSAEVPLVQLTRAMADEEVPEAFEPTVIKLTVGRLVKPGDAMFAFAAQMRAEGLQDLVDIKGGAVQVAPVPDVAVAQREVI
jgi:hypothetical protein